MKTVKHTQTISIPKNELDEMNSIIKGESGILGEHTIATYTAKFENGIEADIKVCGVKEELDAEADQCTPYIDAVLFDMGNEVAVLEPTFEHLDGEYIFNLDGTIYEVIIV